MCPSGMIPLVWNGMMSFGGGWFFLVASEVISVNNHTYALPGIGSYVAAASAHRQLGRLLLAIGVMVAMVIAVNLLFWRPLTAWAERFRLGDTDAAEAPRSLVLDVLRRSGVPGMVSRAARPAGVVLDRADSSVRAGRAPAACQPGSSPRGRHRFLVGCAAIIGWGLYQMLVYVAGQHRSGRVRSGIPARPGDVHEGDRVSRGRLAGLGADGTWIGMNPKVCRLAQPVVQVMASFPANFLFPLFTLALIHTGVSIDVGGILLMSLGAQWYILFNVIAGASAIPNDLLEAAMNLRLPRVLRWRRLILPAIFPAYVTGGITAAGGAWNASIVAEIVKYGETTLTATGLGAYIAQSTAEGNLARTLVGVSVMSIFVVGLNRLFWRPLYRLAQKRYSL